MAAAARTGITLAGVVVLATVVRLAVFSSVGDIPRLHGDELYYMHAAQALAAGEPHPDSLRAPGYPFFASLVLRAFPEADVDGVRVAQILVSLIAVVLVFSIVQPHFGPRAAAISALFCALHPTLISYTLFLWSETLQITLLLLFLWCLDRYLGEARIAWLVGASCAFGAVILTREMFLYFTPVLAWAAASPPSVRRLGRAALGVALVAACIVPWTLRNYRLHHSLVLVSTLRWEALAQGNLVPRDDWLFGDTEETPFIKRYFAIPNELEREAFARQVTLDAIRAQGVLWLPRKIVRNPYQLFTPQRTQLSRFVRLRWLALRAQAAGQALARLELLYYVPHLVLGIVALWLVPGGRLKALVVSLVLFCVALYVVAYANHRYRVPLLPLFSLYSGPLLCGFMARAGRRRWRMAGAGATIAIFLAIVYTGLVLDTSVPHGTPGEPGGTPSLRPLPP